MLEDLDPAVVAFPGLNDTPASYVGHAAKVVAVKATEDGLEFVTAAGLLGDVVGPASAVDDAIARFNTTSGKLIASSGVIINDTPDMLWSVDGSGDIGASGANRPNNGFFAGQLNSTSLVSGGVQIGALTNYTGLDTPSGILGQSTGRTAVLVSLRSDGSGNISTALVADINAAAITTDHVVATIGWVNDSNVYTKQAEFFGGGGLALDSAKAIGTTPTEATGLVLRNSTAAADGAQQYGPSLYFAGQAWETSGGSSDEISWRITPVMTQGAAGSSNLHFYRNLNGAGYVSVLNVSTGGTLGCNGLSVAAQVLLVAGSAADILWTTDGAGDIGASGANRPNNVYAKANVTAAGIVNAYGGNIRLNTVAYTGDVTQAYGYAVDFNATTTGFLKSRIASGAGVHGIVALADVNAASINAGHIPFSVAWADNSSVVTSLAKFYGDGSLEIVKGVGLHGIAAPAQHTNEGETTGFTAGVGTGVNDDSTFTGNSGTKAYTISDVVKALKDIGAMAAS